VTAEPVDRTHRKVRRLTAAVWLLSGVIAIGVFTVAVQLCTRLNPCASLDGSPEKKIRAASVIALARYEKSGSTLRCVITELLKQAPNAAFYYRVGDEFRQGNTEIRENTDYGDGQILFFVGSPAEHCYSVAFSGDRLRSMGEMPITQLRQIIRDSPQ
jgi:hypothetical protein